MKIISIVGARPQFIKVMPLVNEIKKNNKLIGKKIKHVLLHTGQHYDYEMSKVFFKELHIPEPDYNLGVGSGSHGWQTGEMLKRIEKVLIKEKPDWVLVYGDTNSTLAGALAAKKLHIKLAHIEAGLRSYNSEMPEEINRVLTDHIFDFLFCPTKISVENLQKEGIKKGVYITGDIMYDAFLKGIKIAQKESKILEKLNLKPKTYLLLTLHRPQNVDNPENLKKILEVINESGEKVVFPIHPRTKKQLYKLKHLRTYQLTNLRLVDPLGYLDMLVLERNAKKIVSDSGGLQKEAYRLKVPCITLRDRTEWVETVGVGWNILVGQDKEKILKAVKNFNPKQKQGKYFGDAKTAKRIIKILNKRLCNRHEK